MTRTLSLMLAAALLCGAVLTATPDDARAQTVVIETTQGNITVALNAMAAPITVKNYLEYVKSGFFTDTVFHRVIKGFMIQGGGLTADMNKKETRAPIKLESGNGLKNLRGTIAMARTGAPDSATAQFFINHKDTGTLDAKRGAGQDGYAVFGKVTAGMDIVDKIANTATKRAAGRQNVPVEPIVIKSVKLVSEKK